MEYTRIVAVTGLPGLFEILNSKTDGAIVRSLTDNSTKFISARVHNLTHLESIEIYTTGENVSLSEVFQAMKDNSEPLPDTKDNKAIKQYFEKVYPTLDFDRVYTSDMKKMINWFKSITENEIDFTRKEEESTEETDTATETINPKEEKVVLEVAQDEVPEVGAVKTRKRKKKTEE